MACNMSNSCIKFSGILSRLATLIRPGLVNVKGSCLPRIIRAVLRSEADLHAALRCCRMSQEPALREVFLIEDGGVWRAPAVNETCCRRPALANLLELGAHGTSILTLLQLVLALV